MKSLLAAVAVLGCSLLASAQTGRPFVQERHLASGGTVVVTMNVGDLTILPAAEPGRVRLEIHTKRAADQETQASWIKTFEVAGNRATIDLQIPKGQYDCNHDCGTDVTLYVPEQSDVQADLSVGDLSVRGVEGSKDLHTGVGDLKVAVADPSEYGHVETRTRIGDVEDSLNQKGREDGILGQTEDFSLGGRYHLKASTGIGDVHISRDGKS